MKLGLALGAAVLATTMVASAQTNHRFVFHRGGEEQSADTNGDGWLSREEAAADADRMFADLDRDNNGRLEDRDAELLHEEVTAEVERAMANVRVELEGLDDEIEEALEDVNERCTTTTAVDGDERRVTTICRGDGDHDREARRVRIIRHGGDMMVVPPVPPIPPVAPAPPLRFFMNDSEADLNGDGWLSREEFRAQRLREFDASDANGDGRIRYERADPPEPPAPPAPPQPPRRGR